MKALQKADKAPTNALLPDLGTLLPLDSDQPTDSQPRFEAVETSDIVGEVGFTDTPTVAAKHSSITKEQHEAEPDKFKPSPKPSRKTTNTNPLWEKHKSTVAEWCGYARVAMRAGDKQKAADWLSRAHALRDFLVSQGGE